MLIWFIGNLVVAANESKRTESLFIPNKSSLTVGALCMQHTVILLHREGLNAHVDLLSPVVSTSHTLATISAAAATMSHPFKLLMKENRRGVGVGEKDEIMFRLFRVSVCIFPGLTDRPINLIYHVSPHPLTSSTGLLSNKELVRSGTSGVLVPIAFVLQLLR